MLSRNPSLLTLLACEAVLSDAAPASSETSPAKPKKSAPEIEKVRMEDSREVDFVGKRRMLKESVFTDSGLLDYVRFDFRNGRVLRYSPSRDARTAEGRFLSEMFLGHGIEQKLGDETAGFDAQGDLDDMILDVENLIERLSKDPVEWSIRRESGGMAGTSILIKALIEYSGGKQTLDKVKAFLKDKSQADKMALRQSGRPNASGISLKQIVERLEAEKAAKGAKINTDELLGSFEASPA